MLSDLLKNHMGIDWQERESNLDLLYLKLVP